MLGSCSGLQSGQSPPQNASSLGPLGSLTTGKCVSHQARGLSEGFARFYNVAACTQQDEGWETVLRWEREQEKGSLGLPTTLKERGAATFSQTSSSPHQTHSAPTSVVHKHRRDADRQTDSSEDARGDSGCKRWTKGTRFKAHPCQIRQREE